MLSSNCVLLLCFWPDSGKNFLKCCQVYFQEILINSPFFCCKFVQQLFILTIEGSSENLRSSPQTFLFCFHFFLCPSCSFGTKTHTSAASMFISAADNCIYSNSASSIENVRAVTSNVSSRMKKGLSFHMYSEVTTAAIRERLPGDCQSVCRDQVNSSSSIHIGFNLMPCLGTSLARTQLATMVCREKTPVIPLSTVIRLALDDITASMDASSSHTTEIYHLGSFGFASGDV